VNHQQKSLVDTLHISRARLESSSWNLVTGLWGRPKSIKVMVKNSILKSNRFKTQCIPDREALT